MARSIPPPASLRQTFMVLAVLALTGVGATRIILTYNVFSQTYDEPASVAAGMEWLDRGSYSIDYSHPPLARVAVALGPYLDGLRLPAASSEVHPKSWVQVGNQILYARDQYCHNLALARLGVLPFFFLAAAVVWVWSRTVFGDTSALVAVFLFTMLPPVLAHAGLATTDMVFAATFVSALLAFIYWLESPTYLRSSVLGLAVALAILSKFSALLFLPACAWAMLACRWWSKRNGTRSREAPWRRRAMAIALTMVTSFVVIWGGYRFSVHTITQEADRPHEIIDLSLGTEGTLHRLAYVMVEHVPLPAPELLKGIQFQLLHAARGPREYLLGEVNQAGWWYFFPIVLAVKSPLPFLILIGIGLIIIDVEARQGADWRAPATVAIAVTLLLVCMPSRINMGVRLILPIYPILAIVSGFGAVKLWNLTRFKWVGPAMVIVLVLWQLTASVRAHPDYLAYFNELGGSSPERIVVDSDLDWGQDLLRLAEALRVRKIDSVSINYFGTADLSRHRLPRIRPLLPYQPTTGWIAISKTRLKRAPYRGYAWLESHEPVALIGRSILLYYVEATAADR